MPQSRKRRTGRRKPSRGQSAYQPSAARGGGRKWVRVVAALVVLALVAAGAAYLLGPGRGTGGEVTTASGLRYTDIVEGTGPSPRPGQSAAVHYTGTLENGTQFDTSRDGDPPYAFSIGRGEVIKGWDEGIMTMKVGGRRRLVIPPALAYGAAGRPPTIPPNSTLVFDVELMAVK